MKIERLNEIDSTNLYIKRYLSSGQDVVVCARTQSEGRGTKGRSFLSQKGGVYLSKLTFYDKLPAQEGFAVMRNAAVAVCRTLKKYGVQPQIKWPNDILVNGKKLCGILIENVFSGNALRASIVGIGLNVTNDVSPLSEIATSILQETGKVYGVDEVTQELIKQLDLSSTVEEYRSFVHFLGKEVRVTEGENEYLATALSIEEDGRLRIRADAGEKVLSAAEISLRI